MRYFVLGLLVVATVVEAYSQLDASSLIPLRVLVARESQITFLSTDNDDEPVVLKARTPVKRPKPFQGSNTVSGGQASSPSSAGKQTGPSSSSGQGSSKSPSHSGDVGLESSGAANSGSFTSKIHPDISKLSLSTSPTIGSPVSPAQANIGRDRSPASRAQGGAAVPKPDPLSSLRRVQLRVPNFASAGDDFNPWLQQSRDEVKNAREKAATTKAPGGPRSAQRAAKKELEKASVAKAEFKAARVMADGHVKKALTAMEKTKKPEGRHPTNGIVYNSGIASLNAAEAGMKYESAEKKVADTLSSKGYWGEVPKHLSASYRARARSKLSTAHSEAMGHKWNVRVGAAEAADHPADSMERAKTDLEVKLASVEYQGFARKYRTTHRDYRKVREEFPGSSSSESEKDTFNEVLPRKTS